MTPQELKNSILQRAIQGKLVEQRQSEGTAEELYQQIQAEKKLLTAEKKIKKEKPLPEITEEEKPFEIPESWKWVRLANITTLNPKNDLEDACDVSFIPMACVSDGYRNEHTSEIRKWGEIKKGFTHFAAGDIGIAKITPCFQNRKSVIFQDLTNGFGAGTTELSIVRVIGDSLDRKYLLWFFKSHHFIFNGVKSFTGTAGQQRIHKDYLPECLIPLPPLAEQKRIVARIEELLPLIDRYEAAWSRLEDFNKRFPGDMQKSILQQAIQGKLVEQRPEEGTGEELYQQIQAEKKRLIAEKKIKKEKPLPDITEDEKPFEIPEGWKWVRLGTLTETITSGSRDWAKYYSDSGDIFLRMGNLSRNSFQLRLDKIQCVSLPLNAEGMRTVLQPGDLLFSITGEVGMLGLIPEGFGRAFINQHTAMLRFTEILRTRFIPYLLMSDYAQKFYNGNQHGIKNSFRLDSIALLPVPLPPLAEQKRIVAKIEQLLPLCERLK